MKPPSIFISYSHRDEQFREELTKHLSPIKRAGFIEDWHDRCIRPGEKWAEEIDRRIEEADIILLLLSADFVASDYCYEKEMARALERHESGTAVVIPVVIRSVVWEHTPIATLQALPRDARPIEEWRYPDRGWADVVRGVLEVSKGIYDQSKFVRDVSRDARSSVGLPPETTLDTDALDVDEEPPENLVEGWEDTQNIGRSYPVLATLIAEYKRDKEVLEHRKRMDHLEMDLATKAKMPIELQTYLISVIHIHNLEERIKFRIKELQVLEEIKDAREKTHSARFQTELDPQTLGLSATSLTHCQSLLSSEVDEYANDVRVAAKLAELVRKVILEPLKKLADPENTALLLVKIGNKKLDKGDFGGAIKDYTEAIASDPENADAYYKRGLAHLAMDENEEAIKDLDKAIALDPKHVDAYLNRGIGSGRLGEYDKAIKDLDKAIALDRENPTAYFHHGNANAALDQYDKAIKDYDKAIALNPKFADAYYNRGFANLSMGELEKAIKDYDKAIALNPKYAIAYLDRGIVSYRLGEYDKAIKDYTEAIALDPEYPYTYFHRGNANAALKQYEKAIKDYDKAIASDPENADAYYKRGLANLAMDENEEAIKDLDKAIALNPKHANAYLLRGLLVSGHLREYDKAIKDFDEAIALDRENPTAYFHRGNANAALEQYEKAIKDYDKAIALNPKFADAYYNRSVAYRSLGQEDKAIKDYDKAIALNPRLSGE